VRLKVRSTWTTRLLFLFAAVTAGFLALWSAKQRAEREPAPQRRPERAGDYVVEVELAD
jgi:hypothetical protein